MYEYWRAEQRRAYVGYYTRKRRNEYAHCTTKHRYIDKYTRIQEKQTQTNIAAKGASYYSHIARYMQEYALACTQSHRHVCTHE